MRLLSVLLSVIMGSEAMAGTSSSIALVNLEMGEEVREHRLTYEEAFVTQGSYSGIRMVFKEMLQEADYLELSLFIPSHGEFQVGYDSSLGQFVSRIPETPFTFKAERFTEIRDRRGHPRPMKFEFTQWRENSNKSWFAQWWNVADKSWSTEIVELTDCRIDVESLLISERSLHFLGEFVCQFTEHGDSASGKIVVHAEKLGVSKVD